MENHNPIRVIAVIPGEKEGNCMIFAKRRVAFLIKEGIDVREFYLTSRLNPITIFFKFKELIGIIKEFHPHLIHSHFGTMTSLFCALISFYTVIPFLITFRGSDINKTSHIDGFWRDLLGRIFSQLSALKATRIVCVSEQLKAKLWWRKNRAIVIPSCIDTNLFYPRSQSEARAELGWSVNRRIVLFNAGGNPEIKRLDLAKSAVDVAETICGEIQFIILNGNVKQRLIPAMINGADCLLVTSDNEGSPNIVKEAMACNLPVASVDVGDVGERLAGVQPSHIVERDPNEIGKRLAEILNRRSRSNGYEVIQELSSQKLASRVLAVYQEILRQV
jgi:glycosyltransferase involved in cell wall biosynthesis